MANRKLSALIVLEPAQAAEILCKAYDDADALWVNVAKKLHVSVRTLMRWQNQLKLERRLDMIRAKKAHAIRSRQSESGRRAGRQGGWEKGRPRKEPTA